MSVKVELEDGTITRRHHDQLITRKDVNPVQEVPLMDQPDLHNKDAPELPHLPPAFPPQVEDLEQDIELAVRRYPERNRGPPARFE